MLTNKYYTTLQLAQNYFNEEIRHVALVSLDIKTAFEKTTSYVVYNTTSYDCTLFY